VSEPRKVVFYFDYVDPGSYLVDVQLGRLLPRNVAVVRHPFELRPPPQELVEAASSEWSRYLETTAGIADAIGLDMASSDFIPWSRKAHELRLHAAEKGKEREMHDALFRARFDERADLGRVDVLVNLGVAVGLDLTETKAVLDVDRHAEAVVTLRDEAAAAGVTHTPALKFGSESLEGPRGIDELAGLLRAAHLI
jgi:predicted DsbA family dithiol-disulfide isomerase